MIAIKIAGQERSWDIVDDVEESWIARQIAESRDETEAVCVVLRIETPTTNVILATPGCPPTGGVSRDLRPDERRVFELWEARGLDAKEISAGRIVAFLHQLGRLL